MSYVDSGLSPERRELLELERLRDLRELARAQEFADDRSYLRTRRAERFMCALVGLAAGTGLGLLYLFS